MARKKAMESEPNAIRIVMASQAESSAESAAESLKEESTISPAEVTLLGAAPIISRTGIPAP